MLKPSHEACRTGETGSDGGPKGALVSNAQSIFVIYLTWLIPLRSLAAEAVSTELSVNGLRIPQLSEVGSPHVISMRCPSPLLHRP